MGEKTEIVRALYEAFARRDTAGIAALFDPQIEWIQMEGFPEGGRHIGPEAVLNGALAKFRVNWERWQAVVEEYLEAGDRVIALGYYTGTHKQTGRAMRAAFAHFYTVRDGRIVRFVQYTDTLKVAEAAVG
ncbi:MAG: nuclear transport factor 2 family protein [Bacillota bacterium]